MPAAILSQAPASTSLSVVEYLLSVFPAAIDHRASSHSLAPLAPLALSFLKGRIDAASALIAAGADQTARDAESKNLVHLALIFLSRTSRNLIAHKFRSLLSLLDTRLLSSLFTERCRVDPGSLTPLAFWLAAIGPWERSRPFRESNAKLVPEVLSIMLESGGDGQLTMMDGSGQFPLHQAVKRSYTGLVKIMLARDPALLSRENAMGQTPLELAHSLYVRDCAKGNPDIRASRYRPLETRECEEFIEHGRREANRNEDSIGKRGAVRATWEVCRWWASKEPRARKLVSISEAREVARRLAERNKAKNQENQEDTEELKKDEVNRWLGDDPFAMS